METPVRTRIQATSHRDEVIILRTRIQATSRRAVAVVVLPVLRATNLQDVAVVLLVRPAHQAQTIVLHREAKDDSF